MNRADDLFSVAIKDCENKYNYGIVLVNEDKVLLCNKGDSKCCDGNGNNIPIEYKFNKNIISLNGTDYIYFTCNRYIIVTTKASSDYINLMKSMDTIVRDSNLLLHNKGIIQSDILPQYLCSIITVLTRTDTSNTLNHIVNICGFAIRHCPFANELLIFGRNNLWQTILMALLPKWNSFINEATIKETEFNTESNNYDIFVDYFDRKKEIYANRPTIPFDNQFNFTNIAQWYRNSFPVYDSQQLILMMMSDLIAYKFDFPCKGGTSSAERFNQTFIWMLNINDIFKRVCITKEVFVSDYAGGYIHKGPFGKVVDGYDIAIARKKRSNANVDMSISIQKNLTNLIKVNTTVEEPSATVGGDIYKLFRK